VLSNPSTDMAMVVMEDTLVTATEVVTATEDTLVTATVAMEASTVAMEASTVAMAAMAAMAMVVTQVMAMVVTQVMAMVGTAAMDTVTNLDLYLLPLEDGALIQIDLKYLPKMVFLPFLESTTQDLVVTQVTVATVATATVAMATTVKHTLDPFMELELD